MGCQIEKAGWSAVRKKKMQGKGCKCFEIFAMLEIHEGDYSAKQMSKLQCREDRDHSDLVWI